MGPGPIPVHVPTFIALGSKFAVKSPNGQILDNVLTSVTRSFASSHQLMAISRRFPTQYRSLVQGTTQAVLYGERQHFGECLGALRTFFRDSEMNLSTTRAATNPASKSSLFYRLTKWSSIGLACCYGYSKLRAIPGAYLLPKKPVLSALLEEGLALFSEEAAAVGVCFELGLNMQTNPVGALATFCGHVTLWGIRSTGVGGRILSMLLHGGWNAWVSRSRETNLFGRFLKSYEKGDVLVDVAAGWQTLPGSLVLPSYVTKIDSSPSPLRGSVEVFVDHIPVDVPTAFELLREDTARNGTYPILITHRLLHQPANCAANALAALLHRLHQSPFHGSPISEEQRHDNWRKLGNLAIANDLIGDAFEETFSMERVFSEMGKKGPRIREAYENILAGRTSKYKKTVNLKWNETLSTLKEVNGVITMKPRAIQNLAPEVHAIMSPFSKLLNFAMHAQLDGRVTEFEGRSVRLIFASGSNGDELNRIGNLLLDGVFTVVVSGDDSVVSFGDHARDGMPFGEADQSAFDHTQDDGPNRIFQGMLQAHIGLPEEFTAVAYDACSSGYTLRKGRLFVRGECGTQMPTGITTTTTFNSMATLMMWLWWLINPGMTVVDAGLQLGFKVKFKAGASLSHVTFLKGWWLETSCGPVVWYPLPSAVLKLGKMINNPLEVTAFRRRGKKQHREIGEAIAMCAHALASSYQSISKDYPIFGPFLEALRRNAKASPSALRRLEESQKPKATGGILLPYVAEEAILYRYGISQQEIVEVCILLSQINSLPAYVEHPVFDKLAEVDY